MTTLQDCQAMDARDALRGLRELFTMPDGVIYLDGNSLGPLPRSVPARMAQVVNQEWGEGLIRSWNAAGWYDLPRRLGDQVARLIGARPGEVMVSDSTSVNLYKVLSAALSIGSHGQAARRVVLSEKSNFPTDLYIAQSVCREHGCALRLVDSEDIEAALAEDLAVLLLTHVNYRTGAMHDLRALTTLAHQRGALTVWDLAHSAGAVEVDLHAAGADFAVGCGYKYLNGGPGAPAFVWAHPRHALDCQQPLTGWWGHASPFEFSPDYRPAAGAARFLCGTPPVLSMAALECGLTTLLAAEPLGGMAALRVKSLALTDLFIARVEQRCGGHGLKLATPLDHTRRGSQVCFTRAEGAYAIVQALIARGVIGDFRAATREGEQDILRFGFAPLYLSFADVCNAVEQLREVLEGSEWQRPEFAQRQAVT